MADDAHLRRLRTGDVELGISDVLQRHITRHVAAQRPISQKRLDFEQTRPRWYREMVAECIGVFLYVYPGIASTAPFLFYLGNAAESSIFQIGWAYAIGIAFAIIVAATTSGGHFSPAITLAFAVWQGFPWRKVPYYIVAQVFGAFLAGLLLMGQYREQFTAFEAELTAAGLPLVGPQTPASVLCSFPLSSQNNQGYLFFIEFFVCSFIGLVIWAVLDPANPFVSPQSAPFVIGLAYGSMIWGFATITISTNLARDLGTRMVAAIFYGPTVFTFKNYAWISILVNIPATFMATGIYEMFLRDSLDRIAMGRGQHEYGDEGLRRHLSEVGMMEPGATNALRKER